MIHFEHLNSRRVKQIISLYASMTFGLFIGIGVSVVNTRILGPDGYGDYRFLLNFYSFVFSFLSFGFFYSGGRLVARQENESIKFLLIKNLLLITAYISILFCVVAFLFSYLEELIYQNELGYLIRIFLPFIFVYPFRQSIENLLQGDNRIYTLSIFRLGPKTLYLILIISLSFFVNVTLTNVLFLYFSTLAIFIVLIVMRFRPKLKPDKAIVSKIWLENKNYGFHVYIGAITGVASSYLAGLSLGYFVDNINVGYFSLALTATMPLTMIPNAIGTTYFKQFAQSKYIPSRVIWTAVCLAILVLGVFLALIGEIVNLIYPKEFQAVIPLTYYTAVGAVFHGLGDFFNRFLGAHGRGQELRNSNIQIGIVNLLGYIFLVYFIGVYGAALTKLLAGLVYLIIMLSYYMRFVKKVAGHEKGND
jgi:O-antigen/teichoic acid export membrane protein